MQNRFVRLDSDSLSGILTRGGTVLGTSRAKVDKMEMGDGRRMDMRSLMRDVEINTISRPLWSSAATARCATPSSSRTSA